MSHPVTIYDLAPSPHNMKVRIAARIKGIPHEVIEVKSDDRKAVLELTGQPRTPAIRHGDVKLFGSGAILRYFDANFKGPQLYTSDYAGMREIENWERYSDSDLGPPISKTFGQIFAEHKDPKECEAASQMLHAATQKIEDHLASGKQWLHGDRISAADVFCAPFVWYGMVPQSQAQPGTPAAFFAGNLKLGPNREHTRKWCEQVMALRWQA